MSLMIGTAGEHFVCFDCYYQGYSANIVNGQLRYDVIITKKGYFFKVQVKTSTTTTTEGKSYQYVLKYTKNQQLRGGYNKKDVDCKSTYGQIARLRIETQNLNRKLEECNQRNNRYNRNNRNNHNTSTTISF